MSMKKTSDSKEEKEGQTAEKASETTGMSEKNEETKSDKKTDKIKDKESHELKKVQEELSAEKEKYLRMLAEYDNFRKRSQKERESTYSDVRADTVIRFLPVYDNLERALKQENAVVETAENLSEALDKALIYEYDCILLDINLPDGSGLELLRELKQANKSDGVLILSARNSLDDKLEGLNLGADDYLTKPFHLSELIARIRSIVRRKKFDGNALVEIGNIRVDVSNQWITVHNQPVSLNRKEFAILLYLVSNKGRLVSKTALAEHVWGDQIDEADNFEFIYSQIKNIRKKINDLDSGIEIQSIYGVGYKLIES